MQLAVRSSVAAGVALVGTGVIVASPIAPPLPDIHLPAIHAGAMELAATVSPLDAYSQVVKEAIANIQTLAAQSNPGSVLKQVVANQIADLTAAAGALSTTGGDLATALTTQVPGLLQTAFNQISAGDVAGATNSLATVPLVLAQPVIGLLPAVEQLVTQPVQNLVNVAKIFSDPVYDQLVAVGLLGPVISGLGAAGVAVQNVINAVGTGDLQKVAGAILASPAKIADGLLNGGYGPDLGPLVGGGFTVLAGGLFSSGGFEVTPDGNFVLNVAGPVATLQTMAKLIAAAITPPKAVPAAQNARVHVGVVPASTGPTYTLRTTGNEATAAAADTTIHPKAGAAVAAKPGDGSVAAPVATGAKTATSVGGKHAHTPRSTARSSH